MRPFTVALTGGIGSGKSAVAELFSHHGVDVIDTDRIAHVLTAPDGAAMSEIIEGFGPVSVALGGGLDRAWMRALVFEDASARRRLEAILHPLIRAEAAHQLSRSISPYALLVVPLLAETTGAYDDIVDRVLVVDCAETTQVRRVVERNGYSEAAIRAIMASQASRAMRLDIADDVIENEGDRNALAAQVARFHLRYLELAALRPLS
ncbi:MAG: dephospho-CoA kinase [Hydrogenophilales bacterium]|nr:dephospho-CoA kinase [Hydrogenophilales bacterium]